MTDTIKKYAVITNKLGMHLRPAAKISRLANQSAYGVWLTINGKTVPAADVIEILALGGKTGDRVGIKIKNHSDRDILDKIAEFIENGFKE